jgi:metal-responsive CopG/Arc/MetJ family transcriptional regulator
MDQQLFREIENIRGREKRSNFIEYLITEGLKTNINNQQNTIQTPPIMLITSSNKRKKN